MTKLRKKVPSGLRAKPSGHSPFRPLSSPSSRSVATMPPLQPLSSASKPCVRHSPARPTTRERLVQVLDLLRRQQQLLKAVLHQTPPGPSGPYREGPGSSRPRSGQKKPKTKLSLNLLLDDDAPPQRKRCKKIKNGAPSAIDFCY